MPSDSKKKCVRCGYTRAWHGRVDGAPDHEFEMPNNKDVVIEARELLADPQMEPFLFGVTRDVFRALADEVERLREMDGLLEADDIRACDKCDLCEDHHANS